MIAYGLHIPFNRSRQSAKELVHAIPEANAEPLDTLDITFVRGPPRGITISTVPASATMTKERGPDALFPPLSLFSADARRHRRHGLPARRDAAAEIGQGGRGRQVAFGYGDRGASQAGVQVHRVVNGEEETSGRGVQDSFGGLS